MLPLSFGFSDGQIKRIGNAVEFGIALAAVQAWTVRGIMGFRFERPVAAGATQNVGPYLGSATVGRHGN